MNQIDTISRHSLIVNRGEQIIFTSDQHWLYPLFELEDYLKEKALAVETLFLKDKIAGKAAACLIVRLGIRQCHIGILSQRAIPILEANRVEYTYDNLVDHIECRTEDLITDKMSIDEAYLFLRKRAGRVKGLRIKIEALSLMVDEKLIIDHLDLEVGPGEQLIIEGANGTGKTTLLRAILGLIPISTGSITIGEYLVGTELWKENRKFIGYVNQEHVKNNFPISAGEVVQIGLGKTPYLTTEIRYQIELAMRRTGAFHLINQPYHTLSGGEKQRVSLARCLCQNARVILMDEPTSYLDQQGKDDLGQLLYELSQNEAPTIVLVSHDRPWIEQMNWPVKALKGGQLC